MSRLEHSELVLGPFEILTNLGLDPLVMVRKAEERTQAELEVESSYMDLFGVDRSQSQSQRSDPSSPPPRRCKKRE